MGYIDAHVHVWTNDLRSYPNHPDWPLTKWDPPHYGPEDILAVATPNGVDRVVLIQMVYYGTDNRYMLDVIARQPTLFRGIAVVDHGSPGVADEMRELRPRGVTGFRVYAIASAGIDLGKWLDHPGYEAMFRAASRARQAICPLMEVAAIPSLARMCERFPDTPVVVDHLSRIGTAPAPIREEDVAALCGLARFKEVRVKLSAFYALGLAKPPYEDLAPLIRRVVEAFGPRRLMWASDNPFQSLRGSYAASVALIRDRLPFLTAEDKDWILRRTAEELLFV